MKKIEKRQEHMKKQSQQDHMEKKTTGTDGKIIKMATETYKKKDDDRKI